MGLTFKNSDMTKRISLFLLVFIFNLGWHYAQTTLAAFSDVPFNHPNKTAIDYVQLQGIVSGYPDGTYQPDRLLNRAEFTKIIIESRYTKVEIENCVASEGFYKRAIFSDVAPGVWFEKYVCVAKKYGVIDGYPDGTFRPVQTINFAEAAKIVVNSYGLSVGTGDPWFAPFLNKLANLNAVPGTIAVYTDIVDRGLKVVTRGEMAEVIYLLRNINDTIASPDGTFSIKIPEKALPAGFNRNTISIVKVPVGEGPVQEVNGAPMLFYRLEPDGVQFNEPVTFEVKTPTLKNTIPMVFLVSGDSFDMIPNPIIEIDQQTQTASLSGQIAHFSHVGIAYLNEFSIETNPISDQTIGVEFDFVAEIGRVGSNPTFLYNGNEYEIGDGWGISNGIIETEPTDATFPYRATNIPASALLFGPETYTVSEQFVCIRPTEVVLQYVFGLNFIVESSSTSAFVSVSSNPFNCQGAPFELPQSMTYESYYIEEVLEAPPSSNPDSINFFFPDSPSTPAPSTTNPNPNNIICDGLQPLLLAPEQGGVLTPLLVVLPMGKCFANPLDQGITEAPAHPPFCASPHPHANGSVKALDGTLHMDPLPNGCGFGEIPAQAFFSEAYLNANLLNGNPPPSPPPSSGGTFSIVSQTIQSDNCGHNPFMDCGNIFTYVIDGENIALSGSTTSGGNFTLTGSISNGNFSVSGTATVAGVSNVLMVMEGVLPTGSPTSGIFDIGSNGVLPGGCPIIYNIQMSPQ